MLEHLIFERNGRAHKHKEYESFFVTNGEGRVISGEKTFDVTVGSLVTIPPNTDHWMEVENNQILEGFLWYHELPMNYLN